MHVTLLTQGWNTFYCWHKLFIYFSLFKVGLENVQPYGTQNLAKFKNSSH